MSSKQRLDSVMVKRGMTATRSQAANLIKLGRVSIDGEVSKKPGHPISEQTSVELAHARRYVSRAGLKLASVADTFDLDFLGRTVLDVGSSTGGFTDYALQHGAKRVIAVDVGTDQMHYSLRHDKRVELHEKTDIRNLVLDVREASGERTTPQFMHETSLEKDEPFAEGVGGTIRLGWVPDIVVIDVSFISLRQILPHVAGLVGAKTQVVAMVKPQFEAGRQQVNKGVVKNQAFRRRILKDFEEWCRQYFTINTKADSDVKGASGNQERFYLLQVTSQQDE